MRVSYINLFALEQRYFLTIHFFKEMMVSFIYTNIYIGDLCLDRDTNIFVNFNISLHIYVSLGYLCMLTCQITDAD